MSRRTELIRQQRELALLPLTLFFAIVPITFLRARPQQPDISVQVNVVNVPVTVTSRRGDFIRGLSRENFRLQVDGNDQNVSYFAAEEGPAEILVLVETGPAVYLLRHEYVVAAAELFERLGADDRVAIASYSETLQPAMGFTTEKQLATSALQSLNYGLGMAQLNFYDSLGAAADSLAFGGNGNGKKTIVLLTTGLDSSGSGHWERLLAKLQQSNVMVLPVALGGDLRDIEKREEKNGEVDAGSAAGGLSFSASSRALKAIAEETGGVAFFPRSQRDFETAYRRIAALVRHQYSLGFATAMRDGRYHAIHVDVVDASGKAFDGKNGKPAYNLNVRRGFLAAQP